jgi:hypothetical protein
VAWLTGWRAELAVAAMACLVVAIGLFTRPGPAPEAVRSGADGMVRLEAPDPGSLQRRILAELHAAGVTATGYEMLGRHGIDADLPRPVPPQVRVVLERHRIPVPPDGVLRVEVASP